ncbi:MAG: 16S rRNA (cytosine(967)-C(5))-methyltransferase RsmB [Ruminococcus sp.]|nr:16S rRNA (cytosine(967)-C(5))-methyltransferase RsmB [Ruminococcus sp.]
MNNREIILDILLELEKNDGYVNLLLADVLEKYDYLAPKEKAFIKRVTEGTVERRIQIDYSLDTVSKVPVKKMKPLIRQLLRMSVYQMLFMDNIPDAAICSEAVKLAGKRKFHSLQGYVNGVLRNVSRQKDAIAWPDRDKDEAAYLSVMYSVPLWLAEYFLHIYNKKDVETIFGAYLERGPLTLRLEESLSDREKEALIKVWEENGVTVREHPYLPYAMQIERAEGIRHLPGYAEGLFMVQDVSSMLVIEAADIRKGQTLLDLCASPGGKSLHAATKLQGTGKVLSFDISENKLSRMEANRLRMRKENMQTALNDARIYKEELARSADVVLADVPCSGLGVIGKKPDIKYHVSAQSLAEITTLQKEIVTNAAAYVKPGGLLLYSTCTINPQENEKMAEWICEKFNFTPESMRAFLPKTLPEELRKEAETGMLQLLPGIHGTDGFFFARLRRMQG